MSNLNKIYFSTTFEHTWSTIYLYTWRAKRSCSWMLGHIHALMRLVKSKGNCTVRCRCTLRFKSSCAYMFTCFIDFVFTCVLALTIICSHVYLHRWSRAFTFTSYEIHILCWSYTSMFPYFDNRMLLCQHAFKRTRSLSYMP